MTERKFLFHFYGVVNCHDRSWMAFCASHPDGVKRGKRSLHISHKGGRWLFKCFSGCSTESIIAGAGLKMADLFDAGIHCAAIGIRPNAVQSATRSNNSTWTDNERKNHARSIWSNSRNVGGTIVERYLQSRGITIPIPASIRCIPMRAHRDSGRAFPALVAGIQDLDGAFSGVSVAWLCPDGSGKAPVEPQRKIYGLYRSGAVRLSSTLHNLLAMGEGVETMLSVQQAMNIPCWAALSATNLPHVQLPDYIREVIICTDADRAGEAASYRLGERLASEKRKVRIARPARIGRDFNDIRL